MRKVKVAAASLCLLGFGVIISVSTYQGDTLSFAQADQSAMLLEIKDEPVTTTTSIGTTDISTTTTTYAQTVRTTASVTTAAGTSTAKAQTSTLRRAETAGTTALLADISYRSFMTQPVSAVSVTEDEAEAEVTTVVTAAPKEKSTTEKAVTAKEKTTTAKEKITAEKEKATTEKVTTAKEKTTTAKEKTTTAKEKATTAKEKATTAKEKATTAKEKSTTAKKTTATKFKTTTTTTVTTVIEPELPEEPFAEKEPETAEESRAITVTEQEYIMLCNVVGHEYGADWVSVEEKALVAEVIMNRVFSPLFPNTIYDVLMQPYQFAGLEDLVAMDTMSRYVTPSVREAVDLYLAHPEQFDHGYLFFNGDGFRNYFRTYA